MILTDADRATLEALLVAIDEATELWHQLERDMRECGIGNPKEALGQLRSAVECS
jgi:hypothetical protein